MEKKFYLVWNPAGRNPQYRHVTHAAAAKESVRLANANPGETFYVVEALQSACNRGLSISIMVDDEPEIPF